MVSVEQIIKTLENKGYECFVPLEKGFFDVIAKKNDEITIVKTLENIDSLREKQANDLISLASCSNGTVVLIGDHSKTYVLEDGLVYERHGLKTVNQHTFKKIIEGDLPQKKFFKGRIIAEINSKQFKKEISDWNITNLAKEVGVTREAIYNYLKGTGVEFKKAKKLESVLGEKIIKKIDVLKPMKQCPKTELGGYLKRMNEIGFNVIPVHRGFDAVAKEKESLIVDSEQSVSNARKKSEYLKNTGKIFDSEPAFVMEKKGKIKNIPVVTKKEVSESESAEELTDLIKKRSKQ